MSYYIYKICCDDCPDFVYVGSTKAFRQRKSSHKHDCYNENSKNYNNKLYTTIRKNGGWDNWRMVLIEDCGEISFTQSRIREEENRMKLNGNLNTYKCYSTQKERQDNYNNREYVKEKKAQWIRDNKDTRQQKIKCECGSNLRRDSMNKHLKSNKHKELLNKLIK